MTAGVYRIRNRVTGEVYVGSTVNFYQRIGTHLRRLRAGTHANGQLQAAWHTNGREAFSFGVLETTVATNEALLEAEERWMRNLRPTVSGFYNRWPSKQGRCRPLKAISHAAVSDLERGKTKPDLDNLVVIAEALGVSLSQIVVIREPTS